MKRLAAFCALSVLLLSAAPLGAKSYESSEFGYRIDLPEGWGLGGQSQAVKASPLADRELIVLINSRHIRSNISADTALRYLAKSRQRLAAGAADFRVVQEPRQASLGGEAAWSHAVTWTDRSGEQRLRLRTVASANYKDQAIFVVLTTDLPARLWKRYREEVYALMGSFSFAAEQLQVRKGGEDYQPRDYAPRNTSSGPTAKSGQGGDQGAWDSSIPVSSSGGQKAQAVRKNPGKVGERSQGRSSTSSSTVAERSQDYWKKVLRPSFASNRVLDLYKSKKGWQKDIINQRVTMDATTKSTFGLGAGPASSANRSESEKNRALSFFNPAFAK